MVQEETDRSSSDYQTRSCMARSLGEKFKDARNREKQEWAKEKPKLDSACRLRELFINPNDEIVKNAMRKLERPVAAAMPYTRPPTGIRETCASRVTAKPEIGSHESTGNEWNLPSPKTMKTTLQVEDLLR